MKIGFISPNYFFLPYVWGSLRAYAETYSKAGTSLEFVEPLSHFDISSKDISSLSKCDVILASCYVWNAETCFRVLREIKILNPRIVSIVGGPHVPDNAKSFMDSHPYIDFAIHGEGEKTFAELLDRLNSDQKAIEELHNLSIRTNQGTIISPRTKDALKLDFPSPLINGYFDNMVDKHHETRTPFFVLWETNRGCPFSCSFCDWGSATKTKVRPFSIERLNAEMKFFADRRIANLFICDANFGILNRDVELAKSLVDLKTQYGYPSNIRGSFAKNSPESVFEISRMFADSNMLWGTTMSLQSLNPTSLAEVKRQNIRLGDYRKLATRFQKEKIHFYTELIYPLPGESFETFVDGIDKIISEGNHFEIKAFELALLPNADITINRERYNFGTINRYLYFMSDRIAEDRLEIVVETSTVNRDQWVDGFLFSELIGILHNGYYLQYVSRYLKRTLGTTYKKFYSDLIAHFENRPGSPLGNLISFIRRTLNDYLQDPSIPQRTKLKYSEFAQSFLRKYGDRNSWSILHFGWLLINESIENFYSEIEIYLREVYDFQNDELDDLLKFQKELMLKVDYDPTVGREYQYEFDWRGFFQTGGELMKNRNQLTYSDQSFGADLRYVPIAHNKQRFALCAVGETYPDSKIRHFVHDLDLACQVAMAVNPTPSRPG